MTTLDSERPLFTPSTHKMSGMQEGGIGTPLMDQTHTDNGTLPVTLSEEPPKYNNEGYLGSKGIVSQPLDDSQVELGIIMDTGKVKHFDTDDSGSSGQSSDTSTDSRCVGCIEVIQASLDEFHARNKRVIKRCTYVCVLLLYAAYFTWAVSYDYRRATALIVITSLVVLCTLYGFLRDKFGYRVYKSVIKPAQSAINSHWNILRWFFYLGILIGIAVFLVVEVQPHPRQLISVAGLAVFLLTLLIFSKHPSKVNFRPVVWGLGVQFLLAVFILRTRWGYGLFKFLGDQVSAFLGYADYGAVFVFGEDFKDHFFAFAVLPVIVFLSCAISILYHLGAMQFIIGKIAWVMQTTMGTSPTESLVVAGNIFIGQTESPIMIRPFIQDMTKSELHAMMTGGFATIAGGVLAAYIMFGVPAEHLICASVMNAPVALAISKLMYPETKETRVTQETVAMEKTKERNLLEAASCGASSSVKLVANIAANLIAFLALLAFVNAMLGWLGSMVGHPELTFQLICSYLFMPIAFLMGIDWEDCGNVAKLLGVKTFLNEFVAYKELGVFIHNRNHCRYPQISMRSEVITTYALCGFANLSSVGVQLGGIGPMAPSRRGDLAQIAGRALFTGIMACFITACVAGLLTVETPFTGCSANSTLTNVTLSNSTLFNTTVVPL